MTEQWFTFPIINEIGLLLLIPFMPFLLLYAQIREVLLFIKQIYNGNYQREEGSTGHIFYVKLVVLKCSETFIESIPQITLQTYVAFKTNAYDTTEKKILFGLSLGSAVFNTIKTIYKLCKNWSHVRESMKGRLVLR